MIFPITSYRVYVFYIKMRKGIVNPLGLYDVDRKIRPVGNACKKLIKEWKDILADERFGLNFR